MRQLRVKGFYMKKTDQNVQFLQEKRWWGWKTIDHEIVPNHVMITLGCCGDTGGWKSKFAKYGDFGRDGNIKQKEGTQ